MLQSVSRVDRCTFVNDVRLKEKKQNQGTGSAICPKERRSVAEERMKANIRMRGSADAELTVYLSGRFASENCRRNVICMTQVLSPLLLYVIKRAESQMVIETLPIVSVASFDLAVVPRCSRSEDMVLKYSDFFCDNRISISAPAPYECSGVGYAVCAIWRSGIPLFSHTVCSASKATLWRYDISGRQMKYLLFPDTALQNFLL